MKACLNSIQRRAEAAAGVAQVPGGRAGASRKFSRETSPEESPEESLKKVVGGTITKNWLPDMDLNHDKQIQNLLCYRYTIGQAGSGRHASRLNS